MRGVDPSSQVCFSRDKQIHQSLPALPFSFFFFSVFSIQPILTDCMCIRDCVWHPLWLRMLWIAISYCCVWFNFSCFIHWTDWDASSVPRCSESLYQLHIHSKNIHICIIFIHRNIRSCLEFITWYLPQPHWYFPQLHIHFKNIHSYLLKWYSPLFLTRVWDP